MDNVFCPSSEPVETPPVSDVNTDRCSEVGDEITVTHIRHIHRSQRIRQPYGGMTTGWWLGWLSGCDLLGKVESRKTLTFAQWKKPQLAKSNKPCMTSPMENAPAHKVEQAWLDILAQGS